MCLVRGLVRGGEALLVTVDFRGECAEDVDLAGRGELEEVGEDIGDLVLHSVGRFGV